MILETVGVVAAIATVVSSILSFVTKIYKKEAGGKNKEIKIVFTDSDGKEIILEQKDFDDKDKVEEIRKLLNHLEKVESKNGK